MVSDSHKDYKGEKTPIDYTDGPKDQRGCTDCFCFLLFVSFWVGFGAIAIYGKTNGKPNQYLYLYDTYGTQCGLESTAGFKYILWGYNNSADDISLSNSYCVSQCPKNYSIDLSTVYPDYENRSTPQGYPTYGIAGRFCVPTNNTLVNILTAGGVLTQTFTASSVADIQTVFPAIPLVAGAALVIGFIYISLMRCFVGLMTWLLLIFFVFGFTFLGFLCRPDLMDVLNLPQYEFDSLASLSPQTLNIIAISSWVVAGISLLLILVFFNRIRLAIAVLKCASEFIAAVPGTLLIPPIFFLVSLGFYVVWLYLVVYLIGTNQFSRPDDILPFADIDWNYKSGTMFWYFVYGLFWGSTFLTCLAQFVIASACCIWYFRQSREDGDIGTPVKTSLCRGLGLHMGSIAFAAALVAIIQTMKAILTYFETTMRKTKEAAEEHRILLYVCGCVHCCLDCFERFLRFLNKHTFIQIAMTGQNFCKSSQDAFYLTMRNVARFGIVGGLGGLFCFIGQMFITVLAVIVGYIFINKEYASEIYSLTAPICVFILVSFIIGYIFMSVYGVSADTIIHVYCMDEEMHDDPRHAPKLLQEFIAGHVRTKILTDQ